MKYMSSNCNDEIPDTAARLEQEALEQRVANYDQAHENFDLVNAEVDKTEQKIVHLCEVGMTNRDPSGLSHQIDGIAESEALQLLDDLLDHATQEKYQYRHKWQPGDMVMWDNRCLLHKANGDYDHSQTRYLYRVMLKGDAPY